MTAGPGDGRLPESGRAESFDKIKYAVFSIAQDYLSFDTIMRTADLF
jgi:hypothetical protein